MKSFAIVAVLASIFLFSPASSDHLQEASQSLTRAIEAANDALADGVLEAAQKTTALYQASLNIIRSSRYTPNVNSIEDIANLHGKLDAILQEAQASQQGIVSEATQAFEDASNEIAGLMEDTLQMPRDAHAFSFGGQGIEALKKSLMEALKLAQGKMKVIVQKALEKINGGLKKLEGFLARILGEAGVKKVKELLAMQVERILKALADAISKKVAEASKPTFALAVQETELVLEDLESETSLEKRAFQDIWAKVKAAANKLGASIRDAAKKAIEKHRPIIMEKLKELGRAVVAAGKDLIIEVVNGAVKVFVTEM